jgi:hypothetical protein
MALGHKILDSRRKGSCPRMSHSTGGRSILLGLAWIFLASAGSTNGIVSSFRVCPYYTARVQGPVICSAIAGTSYHCGKHERHDCNLGEGNYLVSFCCRVESQYFMNEIFTYLVLERIPRSVA